MLNHVRFTQVLCLAFFMAVGACSTTPKKEFPKDYSAEEIRDTGSKLLGAGDTVQALKYLTMAETKNPKDPVTQYYLGLAYIARRLPDKALEHFQKAVQLKPDYSAVYNAMGAFHAEQGRLGEAEEAFKKALANPLYETPHFALFNLGQLYEKRGDPQKALSFYQDALRLQSGYPAAHFCMGRLFESMGRRDEARRAYGKAIEYNDNMMEAHFHFGRLSFLMGDRESAYSSLSRVLSLDPGSSMAKAAREYLQKIQGTMPQNSSY